MKNKNGFTLTEVLLAVMIVAIIGVALAALTTSASRESGAGNTRIMLRNNHSLFLRTLRQDVNEASRMMYMRGPRAPKTSGNTPLLLLAKNLDYNNQPTAPDYGYVLYCFEKGNTAAVPTGATSGGVIRRSFFNVREWTGWQTEDGSHQSPNCDSGSPVLKHVKYIPQESTYNYPVPLFGNQTWSFKDNNVYDLGSVLDVKLITELNSTPVVNEPIEETFVLGNGFEVVP